MFTVLPLRLGLGIVMGFFGVMGLLHPNDWIGFMPAALTNILTIDGMVLLKIISVTQIVVAFGLLMRPFMRFVFPIAFLVLLVMVGTSVYQQHWDYAAMSFGLLCMGFYGTWRSWTL